MFHKAIKKWSGWGREPSTCMLAEVQTLHKVLGNFRNTTPMSNIQILIKNAKPPEKIALPAV